ncbi:adenylyl cyclase [Buttiauxella noackiae ATCC 51607]|uniref:diguanylate cyclase n=1 Tax=Buttiauxella noackiae ATCC 51607 TaxID=1354255 RepID=A0A1B7HUQ3_9ENTR|nr:GGDEF domain-containing protein [Buttiauxella noackiae]OAT19368.1 adenylyl cyclase [Buttiauxella noackiae ATCC 51607]
MSNQIEFVCFSPEKRLANAINIFVITTLFYFFGASLRLIDELSLFWPLNAVLAAVFVRNPFLNRPVYYFLCYSAMVIYDAFTTHWGWQSAIINLSNMVFIIIVALLLLRYSRDENENNWAINAFKIFYFCLIGAVLSSLLGSLGSLGPSSDYRQFLPLFADWFSEQFSTGVLMMPFLLMAKWPQWGKMPAFHFSKLYPLLGVIISVIASVVIGGAGSLAFPLPALIWCAIRYPLPITALITLLTGGMEIVLVANSIVVIHHSQPLVVNEMFSARLGIATMAICPLIVSVSVDAINRLIKQTSLRADYDYLTGVHSRSGLYEALKITAPLMHKPGQKLCVMLLDIDYFKRINDNYGHECGDVVLRAFAAQLRKAVGEEGLVARLGGEEFVVACSTNSEDEGYKIAEKIRQSIELTAFRYQQQTLFITVSIGLAATTPEKQSLLDAFNALLAEADKYLYLSKRSGRNQVSTSLINQEDIAASV